MTVKIEDSHRRVLKQYPRALVHMRTQLRMRRFSLIFGAGLSKSFRLPDWPTLVNAIAADPDVNGQEILKRFSDRGTLPYRTELLFQHFRTRQADAAGHDKLGSAEFENSIWATWLKICAKYLYKEAPTNFEEALNNHPYLLRYVPIIQQTPITITYNFDEYIERALLLKKDSRDTLGYETVTNPWTQFRRQTAVVYHPHGVLPTELMEIPRDRVVFSESSYARLFLGSLAGDFSFLLSHMSKNTCLIIGSSLEDEDLRNILVQGGQAHPGNAQYYIYYLQPGETISLEDQRAIERANFQVYNLVTLFLTADEIAALGDLLHDSGLSDAEFVDQVIEVDNFAAYRFYLTGPLGVGKSTTSSQLRNFIVLDEWSEPRLPLLAKAWDTLTPDEKKQADSWIAGQFRIKNDKLRHEQFGVLLIDRPPMDPLAFTPDDEKAAKAKFLLETICPANKWSIADGMVILLIGDPEDLAARNLSIGRTEYTADKLMRMENELKSVYNRSGVRVVDTRGRSVGEVTKTLSEIIHFEEYKPFDFMERFRSI